MLDPARPADIRGSRAVPIATLAVALGVFIVDTATPFEINIGLFYLPVVLLAARFLRGRQLILDELLETIFPVPLAEIEAELRRTGRWAGELVHSTRRREAVRR